MSHATDALVGPFASFGRSWDITARDANLARYVADLYRSLTVEQLAPCHRTFRLVLPEGDGPGTLYRDGETMLRHRRSARLLGRLIWAINRHVIDGYEGDPILHAGAVADANGDVVVLPAAAGSGKTTLCSALLARGYAYLSDEAVLLGNDHMVEGFTKPLSLKPGSWRLLPAAEPRLPPALTDLRSEIWQTPPTQLGATTPRGRLTNMVLPTYRDGAETSIVRLRPIDALDLVRRSVFGAGPDPTQRPLPVTHLRRLARALESVPCFELRFSDLTEGVDAIAQLLGKPITTVGGSRRD